MPAQPFSAETVVVDGRATITLSGDLNGTADDDLTRAYDEAHSAGMSALTLDFSRAAYINSTGIAVLVRILAAGRRDGIQILARGLSPHYIEIFEITRISDFMRIERDDPATVGGIA
ncbi:MAG: STAS domain-containing protein [Candidatus Limnocylindrales bacterium]